MRYYSGKVCFSITNRYAVPYPVTVSAGNVVQAATKAIREGSATFKKNHARARVDGITLNLNVVARREE
jgi:hypothetical protein